MISGNSQEGREDRFEEEREQFEAQGIAATPALPAMYVIGAPAKDGVNVQNIIMVR